MIMKFSINPNLIRVVKVLLPGEKCSEEPSEGADEGCPGFCADVTSSQRFTDRVVSLEADRQNCQH